MRIIKVLATNSTNLFLRDMYRQETLKENYCVVAEEQTQGRGQMGATWISEKGKNLTFSVLLTRLDLSIEEQFKLSALVAMALVGGLKKIGIENLAIKWPNDILAGKQKVCGILIENILAGRKVASSIVGIGLNVNQLNFEGFPQASSLRNVSGKEYDLDELLQVLLTEIETTVYDKVSNSVEKTLKEYEAFLFMLKKPATFELPTGERKTGIIQQVTKTGRLEVKFEEGEPENFDIKEIKLLY